MLILGQGRPFRITLGKYGILTVHGQPVLDVCGRETYLSSSKEDMKQLLDINHHRKIRKPLATKRSLFCCQVFFLSNIAV